MIRPRARSSGGTSDAIALYAPRILNAPMGCSDSALSHWLRTRPARTGRAACAARRPGGASAAARIVVEPDELRGRLGSARRSRSSGRTARWQSMHSAAPTAAPRGAPAGSGCRTTRTGRRSRVEAGDGGVDGRQVLLGRGPGARGRAAARRRGSRRRPASRRSSGRGPRRTMPASSARTCSRSARSAPRGSAGACG